MRRSKTLPPALTPSRATQFQTDQRRGSTGNLRTELPWFSTVRMVQFKQIQHGFNVSRNPDTFQTKRHTKLAFDGYST